MKYIMVVGDGMADGKIAELGGQTPLEHLVPAGFQTVAGGEIGRLRSCPETLPPGSDVAFLTLLGNDTVSCYTGRSPLEAAGLGAAVGAGEVAYRMNLTAVEDGKMMSHNGGGIEGEEALTLAKLVADLPECAGLRVTPTDTFRHVAVARGRADEYDLTPPHDIIGREIAQYLPGGALGRAMAASYRALNDHPINRARRRAGKLPANMAWFWGAGTACLLDSFAEKFGVQGFVASAVPLVKGIARLGGLEAPDIPGATGLLDTDYEAKVAWTLRALQEGCDFALLHVEAPDEMSHDGSLANKLESIRRLNARVVEPLLRELPALGDFRLLLLPDHYTLLSTRTHDGTPVPFALYDSRTPGAPRPFTESLCENAPLVSSGEALLRKLFA